MQPFLQNSHNAALTSQSGEIPKYLELLADNEDIILRENSTSGYEVPLPIHIAYQNLTKLYPDLKDTSHYNTLQEQKDSRNDNKEQLERKGDKSTSISSLNLPDQTQSIHIAYLNLTKLNKCSANPDLKDTLHNNTLQEQQDSYNDNKEQFERKGDNRSSISSLNLPDRRRASTTSMTEKCNTLDSSKLTVPTIRAILKRDSFTLLTDQRKNKRNVIERRGSEVSLEGRSSSSLSSNISLAPPTRPSSSLISSQNVLPLKNGVISSASESTLNDSSVTKNILPKIQRTHSNLQNGKANIPLVINRTLLNLLRQTPVVEDGNNIVTYTNINTDAVRVNGS